jgi:hypothetical protein
VWKASLKIWPIGFRIIFPGLFTSLPFCMRRFFWNSPIPAEEVRPWARRSQLFG